jgi:branched-chain amino acid aminotransferase
MKLTPQPKIWWNGELVAWEKAQVHVLSHAMHYASSAFEGIRAYATPRGPAVLALDAHVERLFHSCKIVRLPIPFAPAVIRSAILDTIRANAQEACYIRPLVYRGYGALGVWPDECPVEVAIATFPWVKKDEAAVLENGLDVGVSSWRRMAPDTLPAMAKCAGNYVNSALAVSEAKQRGFHEAVLLDIDGYVSEGTGQNIFLVHKGRLSTPPVGASILAGVTRSCVMQLARDLDIPVVEHRLPREMLYTADEAFFTGTVAEVTPIRSVDGLQVGDGKRGSVTKALQQAFFAAVRGQVPDRHDWLTPVRSG